MLLLGDYHTHTVYSHGKGSIEDNVKSAIKKGLTQIAITDHGINHTMYGVTLNKIKQMREEINLLKKKYPEISILLGVEANLISHDGDIDINPELLSYLDILLVGFHKTAKPKNLQALFKFYIPNWLKIKSKKQLEINTNAYLKMLEKYPNISVVTHLNYACPINAVEVAKACNKNNVMVELNGKRTLFSCEDIQSMIELNTMFIINSDAHSAEKVGVTTHPTNIALINRIPISNIANMDKLAPFKYLNK